LKGDRSASTGPRVEVEDSSGKWRRATSWPPRNRETLQLTAAGALSWTATKDTATALLAQDSRSRHYLIGSTFPAETTDADDPTPRELDDVCVTCAKFTLPVKRQLRFAGLPELFVDVTPTAPS